MHMLIHIHIHIHINRIGFFIRSCVLQILTMCVLRVRSVQAQTSRVYTEKQIIRLEQNMRSNCFQNKLNKK